MVNVYLYSSVRNFVIEGTHENGENWYMTNNNQFTVDNMIDNRPIDIPKHGPKLLNVIRLKFEIYFENILRGDIIMLLI